MGWWLLALGALASCGRIGFDEASTQAPTEAWSTSIGGPEFEHVHGLAVAGGTAGIGLATSWGALLASVAVAGIGGGLMDAGVHTIVARVSVDVPRGINRLNVCFAIGAIIGIWFGYGELARAWTLVVVFDAVGSYWAVKRFNEKRVPPESVQRWWAIFPVLLAFAAALITRER